MIKSVRVKVFLYFTLFLVFFVYFSTFINIKFYDKYFVYRSESIFYDAYERINEVYLGESESLRSTFGDILGPKFIRSMIIDKETLTIKYDSKSRERTGPIGESTGLTGERTGPIMELIRLFMRKNINEIKKNYLYEVINVYPSRKNYNNTINDVILDPSQGINIYAKDPHKYRITEIIFIKELDRGDFLVLRKPIHINDDNIKIANEFLLSVGTISILLGSIFVFFFSKQLTKPIIELSQIARSISKLDFSKKYKVKTKDEIGILGDSINLISEELHGAMDDLREANYKLKEDIERKKEIDEMRKRFISSVSHELKSPIGITRGYVEGLKYNVANNEAKRNRYYDILIDEAEKMDKMVGQLLNLSDLESETFELDESIFNISVLINIVVEKFDHILKEKGIEVKISIGEEYFISADSLKIEQVISNYLSNAINHVDERKYIEIRTALVDEKVRVSVINSGKNIPEEDLKNIWDSFYKVDKARSREYGGTGLGLSIVKSIMDQHQGIYGVRNKESCVEFWFELNRISEECLLIK
ncbi:ATP-binding protein [Wukongibacter baidiensis]|uniref:sensor histidine kinase n=1 Tax=Wukongibacter baidiensis TaxID=1723361 RepID=UPI003D7F74A9